MTMEVLTSREGALPSNRCQCDLGEQRFQTASLKGSGSWYPLASLGVAKGCRCFFIRFSPHKKIKVLVAHNPI